MKKRKNFSEKHKESALANKCSPQARMQSGPHNAARRETSVDAGPMRLNRAIAAAGFCSRRKADEYIAAGRVRVNGVLQNTPGAIVGPEDTIAIDGEELPRDNAPIYIMMNKPIHTLCTAHDPQGRQTVFDILPERLRAKRLFYVGRLDYFSEGLLLLTNDGQLSQRLSHPSHEHEKVYEALVRETPDQACLDEMRAGMLIEPDFKLAPIQVVAKKLASGHTLLTMILKQGVNRQIRRMCEKAGLTILKLRRISQGPLKLGNLPTGNFRMLSSEEISQLFEYIL